MKKELTPKQLSKIEQKKKKKEFQFFATPSVFADELVKIAELEENEKVLEPSAGQGSIVNAINRVYPTKVVDCFELMQENTAILKGISTVNLIGTDFLNYSGTNKYDVIIANPPFSKNQDIQHITKMYSLLNKNGRLISVCSPHPFKCMSNYKKEAEFRDFLKEVDAKVYRIKENTFKESGTLTNAVLIIIDKNPVIFPVCKLGTLKYNNNTGELKEEIYKNGGIRKSDLKDFFKINKKQ